MRTNNKEIINEIHQIRRMMGLKTNNNLLTEAMVGGGILDDIIGLLAKKTPDDLLSLGFKNAEEVLTFVREFPTSSIIRQSEIVGNLIVRLGDSGLTNLTKQLLDDTNSYIGKIVSDRVSVYEEMAKKYPNVSPDEFVKSMKEDMLKTFQGANPNVQSLVKKIEQESGERVRNTVSKNVKNTTTYVDNFKVDMGKDDLLSFIDEAFPGNTAIKSEIEKISDVDLKKSQDAFNKLSDEEVDNAINKVCGTLKESLGKDWCSMDVKEIKQKTKAIAADTEYKNTLASNIEATSNLRQEQFKSVWRFIKWSLIVGLVAGGVYGGVKVYDYFKGTCDKTENDFIVAIKSGFGDSYVETNFGGFDPSKCEGSYDGVTYMWDGSNWVQK